MASLIDPNSAAELLSNAFQCPRGTSFFDDFPIWHHSSLAKLYGIHDSVGKLICTGGIRITELKYPQSRVALLGAIATLPEVRGQGLASKITEDLVGIAENEKCDLAVLWGSEWQLYGRLGFEPAGIQQRMSLSHFANIAEGAALEVQEGWNSKIIKLMMERSGGIRLSPGDEKWISSHKNTRWFWIGEKDAPKAYAALGRGIDLMGLVHEWGGEAHALAVLLSGLNEILPPETELLGHPNIWPSPSWQDWVVKDEVLCLLKRFHFPKELDSQLWFWGLDAI